MNDLHHPTTLSLPSLPQNMLEEARQVNWLAVDRDIWGMTFEAITYELYRNVLRPGDHAIDCGVNVGDHTQAMATCCGRAGRVSAFEAAPVMLEGAKRRLAAFETICWFDKAVTDRTGDFVDFDFYPEATGVSSLRGTYKGADAQTISVPTITLDDAINGDVDLIKLDIEGAEYHALRGAARIMDESRPVIIFENGRQESADRFGYSKDNFFELFNSRGYFVYSVAGMPLTPENWEIPEIPWQFVAIHPVSSRASSAYSVLHRTTMKLLTHR